MASRVCIAAAGCMVASGLFMAGASAAIAVADPTSDQGGGGGDGAASQAGGPADTGPGSPSDAAASGPSTSMPTAEAAPPASAAGPPKPTSQVGDGRNGRSSGDAGGHRGPPPAGKQTGGIRPPPPQTPAPGAGEPTATSDPTGPASPPAKPWHEHHPGMGWPWWGGPCPGSDDPDQPDDPDDPGAPGLPPGTGGGVGGIGGGGGGGGVPQAKPPSGRPTPPPEMQLPPPRDVPPELPGLSADPLANAGAGLGAVAAGPAVAPIAMPVLVAPAGPAGMRPGNLSAPRTSGDPRGTRPPSSSGRQEAPAFTAGSGMPPASFRVGYGNYLRTAGVGQMMAIAVPGVVGILALTGAGGLLGYRQARAGHAVRASDTARFMD